MFYQVTMQHMAKLTVRNTEETVRDFHCPDGTKETLWLYKGVLQIGQKRHFVEILGNLKQPINQLRVIYYSWCLSCDKGIAYSNIRHKEFLESSSIIFVTFCEPKNFPNKKILR